MRLRVVGVTVYCDDAWVHLSSEEQAMVDRVPKVS